MTGVDTDPDAIRHAKKLLESNASLQPFIDVHIMQHLRAERDSPLHASTSAQRSSAGHDSTSCTESIGHAAAAAQRAQTLNEQHSASMGVLSSGAARQGPFAFCVCNPPFFESFAQASQNPATAVSGTPAEMACRGGEAAFVGKMIEESAARPGMCHWFTSMLGRKGSFKQLRQQLHSMPDVTAVRSTRLAQGRTHRWVLAWSFSVARELATKPLPQMSARCAAESEERNDAAAVEPLSDSAGIEGPAKKRRAP